MRLRAEVLDGLRRHGLAPRPDDTAAALRERLNDLYVADVRRLRDRQRAGEIPLAEYAGHVEALKLSYPLLGLPAGLWVE